MLRAKSDFHQTWRDNREGCSCILAPRKRLRIQRIVSPLGSLKIWGNFKPYLPNPLSNVNTQSFTKRPTNPENFIKNRPCSEISYNFQSFSGCYPTYPAPIGVKFGVEESTEIESNQVKYERRSTPPRQISLHRCIVALAGEKPLKVAPEEQKYRLTQRYCNCTLKKNWNLPFNDCKLPQSCISNAHQHHAAYL